MTPIAALDNTPLHIVGVVAAMGGIIATVWAQHTMGDSWRIGVDTNGTTMTPNPVALTGLVLMVVSIELQVRKVEEPYLLATHNAEYRNYTTRVGHFVPGIGKLTAPD